MKYGLYNLLFPKKRYALKVNLILHIGGWKVYDDKRELTKQSEAQLIGDGYIRTYGLVDDFKYIGVPVYTKLSNWREYKLDPVKDARDTSYTLDDFRKSNTTEKFKKGLSKLTKNSSMDIKMIGVIVLVVVIAAGFIFLFGGR